MEIEGKAKFDVAEDQIEFSTRTNGDYIRMRGMHLTKESAGALAYMVNSGAVLEVKIKIKGA